MRRTRTSTGPHSPTCKMTVNCVACHKMVRDKQLLSFATMSGERDRPTKDRPIQGGEDRDRPTEFHRRHRAASPRGCVAIVTTCRPLRGARSVPNSIPSGGRILTLGLRASVRFEARAAPRVRGVRSLATRSVHEAYRRTDHGRSGPAIPGVGRGDRGRRIGPDAVRRCHRRPDRSRPAPGGEHLPGRGDLPAGAVGGRQRRPDGRGGHRRRGPAGQQPVQPADPGRPGLYLRPSLAHALSRLGRARPLGDAEHRPDGAGGPRDPARSPSGLRHPVRPRTGRADDPGGLRLGSGWCSSISGWPPPRRWSEAATPRSSPSPRAR